MSDPNSMSNGTPYLSIYQSLPHPTLVLNTHSASLKNIKEWIVGSEKLYKSHHLGQSLCLANKNNPFLLMAPFGVLITCTYMSAETSFSLIDCKTPSKIYCRGHFTALAGHALI